MAIYGLNTTPNIPKKTKNASKSAFKGGWHDFQYFDHKSSWQWDLWENV